MLIQELIALVADQSLRIRLNAYSISTMLLFQLSCLMAMRTMYTVLKRDNYLEMGILLAVPGVLAVVVAFVQGLILSDFLAIEPYNPWPLWGVLLKPNFAWQHIACAVWFLGIVLCYGLLDRRLNETGASALLFMVANVFEITVAVITAAIGVGVMRGDAAWMTALSPTLWKWFAYGVWQMTYKGALYTIALLYGLLFSNRRARYLLWSSGRPGRRERPLNWLDRLLLGQFGSGAAYVDYDLDWDDEGPTADPEKRVKAYIRERSLPYAFGVLTYGLLFLGLVLSGLIDEGADALQPDGIAAYGVMLAAALGILILACIPARAVLFPQFTGAYKALAATKERRALYQQFCREFFDRTPIDTMGKAVNFILTRRFLVVQSPRLRIIPLEDVAAMGTDFSAQKHLLLLRLRNGKRIKLSLMGENQKVFLLELSGIINGKYD